jgi:hypothetical protein
MLCFEVPEMTANPQELEPNPHFAPLLDPSTISWHENEIPQ